MDRTIIATLEQMRSFDYVQSLKDTLVAIGGLSQDVLSQLASTSTAQIVVGGVVASQTAPASLVVNLGAGRIYSLQQTDLTAGGAITADSTVVCQQGISGAQTVTLVAPATGQSQWNLIQASWSQVDAVRPGDPTGGIVPFFNSSNPTVPNPVSINTVRQSRLIISVVTGAAAPTGSEIPPQPSANCVPLYLIDLVGGQSGVTTSQILRAGPSVGTGVPSNYPSAPFISGLLAKHHTGLPGAAPKIDLASEVAGILPYASMSPVRTLLGAPLNLYVNGSTGNDSNPGTSPTSPFRTLQAATNAAYRNYDLNGNTITVNVANGTYTAGIVCVGLPPGAFGGLAQVPATLQPPPIAFVGNVASPGSVVISATNSNGIVATSGACISLNGFTLTATGTSANYNVQGIGLYAFNNSSIQYQNVIFGACSFGHVVASANCLIESAGQPFTIAGSAPQSILAQFGSTIVIVGSTVTLTGTPAFSNYFASAQACGILQANGVTFVGSATGTRYSVQTNGVILTGGGGANYLPGSLAGSAITGGQYT